MDFLHDSYRKLFFKLLPAAIGAMLSETVASLIDTVILSHYLGADMLSTVSLCMPVYMFVNLLSMLIVSGGATLFAQSVGRGEHEEAQRYYTCSFILMVLCGVVMTFVGQLFTEPIVRALGADNTVLEPTLAYARVLFSFMISLLLYQQLMVYVRVDGSPMLSLISTIACAVVNLVLDILFVGTFGWGPAGAAAATCLSYTVAMLINATHLLQKKNGLIFRKGSFSAARILRILKNGIPLSVTQLGMTLRTSLFNKCIISVGGTMYLDIYAVITQLEVVAMALYEGIAQGCHPIIAACFGAKDRKRLNQTVRYGFSLEVTAMLLITGIYCCFPSLFTDMFSLHEEAQRAAAIYAIRVYAFSLLFTGLNTMIVYYFQVQERQFSATGITLLSGTILPVVFLFVLTSIFDAGGIWWCYMAAQGLTLVLSSAMYIHDRRKNPMQEPLLHPEGGQ